MSASAARHCDANLLPQASYSFDYDEIDARLNAVVPSPEELSLEFLVRGLLIIQEDLRPHLCMDCMILAVRHPTYRIHSLQTIADWNGVTKAIVSVRTKALQEKLGLSEAAVSSLNSARCGPLYDAAHALWQAITFLQTYTEPKSVIDCIVRSTSHPISEGVSLHTIALRYGVTKASIHKQMIAVKENLNLPRARCDKSPESSDSYATTNPNTFRVGEIRNGLGLQDRPLTILSAGG